jgi:HK97 gp10 family phage protein
VVKSTRPPGQAARSVIVYRRRGRGSYIQAEVNANLSLLVGYEKKMAYYMFFNEVGTRFEPARPVIRPVFDAGVDEALQTAIDYIQKDMEKRLGR